MNQKRIIILTFYSLIAIGTGILVLMASKMNHLLQTDMINPSIAETYFQLQKLISYTSIAIFIVLLLVAFYLFYLTQNKNPILLANILYIGITLIVFIDLNRKFFELHHEIVSKNGTYWLYLFIGIFYILGAILVSAIGYITIKNLNKRNTSVPNKNRRSKSYH
jgi:predicted transporter